MSPKYKHLSYEEVEELNQYMDASINDTTLTEKDIEEENQIVHALEEEK